jgi:hypothetical protein
MENYTEMDGAILIVDSFSKNSSKFDPIFIYDMSFSFQSKRQTAM